MKTALTLTLLLVAPTGILGQDRIAGSLPTVDGYRLGDMWQVVGRLMPCRSGPDGLETMQKAGAELSYPQLLAELRICHPSDTLRLHFFRDTLFRIEISGPTVEGESPTATWNRARPWAVATLGVPDSVVAHSGGMGDLVTAHWDSPRAEWQARVTNYAPFAFLDMVYCGFLPAVCEALFSPLPKQ